jgi:hypothetical protein
LESNSQAVKGETGQFGLNLGSRKAIGERKMWRKKYWNLKGGLTNRIGFVEDERNDFDFMFELFGGRKIWREGGRGYLSWGLMWVKMIFSCLMIMFHV